MGTRLAGHKAFVLLGDSYDLAIKLKEDYGNFFFSREIIGIIVIIIELVK